MSASTPSKSPGAKETGRSQRIVFSFDPGSLSSLNAVKERGKFSSLGTTVRASVQLQEVLQEQVEDGFTEVIVRNPITNQEKVLYIPALRNITRERRETAAEKVAEKAVAKAASS